MTKCTYEKDPTCPKCGSSDVKMKYRDSNYNAELQDIVPDEILECRCGRCDYLWGMACVDAPPAEPEQPEHLRGVPTEDAAAPPA